MKQVAITLSLAALTGCGAGPVGMGAPDLTTEYRSEVHLNAHQGWIDAAEASTLQKELLTDLRSEAGANTNAAEPGLKWDGAEACLARAVYIIDDYPVPHCESGHACFGYQSGPELHVGASPANGNGEGPRASAFKHETIHWLQDCVLGVKDPDHRRPEWKYQ